MTVVDLSTIETALLQLAGICLLAVLSYIGRLIIARLHIQISDDKRAELEDVAGKALSWAMSSAGTALHARNWDTIDVKNQVVADAARYAINRFPDPLARSGLKPSNLADTSYKLTGLLERKYTAAAATHVSQVAAVTSMILPPALPTDALPQVPPFPSQRPPSPFPLGPLDSSLIQPGKTS